MNPFLNVNCIPTFFGKDSRTIFPCIDILVDPSTSDEFFDIDRCSLFSTLMPVIGSDNSSSFAFIKREYEWIEEVRGKAGRSTYREIYNCISHALEHEGSIVCSPNRSSGDNVSYLFCQIGTTDRGQ